MTKSFPSDHSGARAGSSPQSDVAPFRAVESMEDQGIEGLRKQFATHRSYWVRKRPAVQRFPSLEADVRTDVLIMGSGITGLSIALRLLQDGLRVVICESNLAGWGTTTGSTGHLDAHPEYEASAWIKKLGREGAKELTALRLRAIDLIESRCDERCHFKRIPAYNYTDTEQRAGYIAIEADAASQCGLDVELTYEVPFPKAYCGYRIDQMGRFDCAAYHERLLHLVIAAGAQVFERSLVSGPSQSSEKWLRAGKGTVHFDQVVCATHANQVASLRLDAQLIPSQSYVIAARIKDPIDDALFWDDCNPYHYVRRIANDGHEVLIGGKDHRTGTGDPVRSQASLELWARERFAVETILGRWSAEFFDPVDELPFIGRVPDTENVWIATGLSGIGLTLGTVAGEVIGNLMCGKPMSIAESISPSRAGAGAAVSAIKAQLPAAADYLERILPAASIEPSHLQSGEGKTGMSDGKYVAVCRDREGCLHTLNPICTHMGGVVHWNEVEQTWDCPVHGGRFTADGKRLYGPPQDDLKPLMNQSPECAI